MSKIEKQENKEFTREELQEILTGLKEISMQDLEQVFSSVGTGGGDEREEYTLDALEIERDIFGSKFCG